jgi:tRNA(Ile)-lysidine synthase
MKATLQIRQAVRPWVYSAQTRIAIGVSGGADSMALACATILEAKQSGIDLIAVIVDHNLQEGSDRVAEFAAQQLFAAGISSVIIKKVDVELTDGIEASARRARYLAFQEVIDEINPNYFLLAHTLNDQAESVLLGLARGSGTKSLSAMAEVNGKFIRPLLAITRDVTLASCVENSVQVWSDPHNEDPAYLRVRVRNEILPLMEERIGPGIIAALGRSATILRQDSEALDFYANQFLESSAGQELERGQLQVQELAALPAAVRMRVLRAAIFRAGAPLGSLSADHLAPIEALVTDWHGQGRISLPGGVKVERISGRLSFLVQP